MTPSQKKELWFKMLENHIPSFNALAEKVQMSRNTMLRKVGGQSTFSVDEAAVIAELLHLNMQEFHDIFLPQ